MPKILFTRDETVPAGAGPERRFLKGEVYDLPDGSCTRWKRRGAAVDAPPERKAKPVPTESPVAPKAGGDKLTAEPGVTLSDAEQNGAGSDLTADAGKPKGARGTGKAKTTDATEPAVPGDQGGTADGADVAA